MANDTFTAERETELMVFLLETLSGRSRTAVKSLLSHRQVTVNGRPVTQFDHPLRPGDRVVLSRERPAEPFRHPMLRIVYEDDSLLVIDKRNGLLSMGTDRERERTAYFILSTYVKKRDPRNRIFIVHRLDRDTSGLMLFAKNEKVKIALQESWETAVFERKYVAVTEGRPSRPEGRISTYLTENKGYKVFVSNKNTGEKAETMFRVLEANDSYALLELELATGKKNQIRAHMEYIGIPLAGDKKYGAQSDPIGRVALHAYKLGFVHPVTGERLSFSTPVPARFATLVK